MSGVLTLTLLSLLVALTSGCDGRYEWKNDEQGRMVRIDKWTGNVAVLKDDKLILVPALKPKTRDDLPEGVKVTRLFDTLEKCRAVLQKLTEKYPGITCLVKESYEILKADGTALPNEAVRDAGPNQ